MWAALMTASAAAPSASTLLSLPSTFCSDHSPYPLYALLLLATLSLALNGFFLVRPSSQLKPQSPSPASSAAAASLSTSSSAASPATAGLSLPPPSSSSRSAHYPSSARMKMVLCVRADLGMTKGKMCAQSGHAAVGVVDEVLRSHNARWKEALLQWERKGAMKIALRVGGEEELELLQAQAESLGLPHHLVVDAGHTQIAPNSQTVLAIGPSAFEEIDPLTGHLKLL